MPSKKAYVMREGQTRDHECHWPGCGKQVPPAMWGCKYHWFRLPKSIRDKIWAAYAPGQEKGEASVSQEYFDAANEAQRWIEDYKKRQGERNGTATRDR